MRVLVLGSGGMMGHAALRKLEPRGEVEGTVRSAVPTPELLRVVPTSRRVRGNVNVLNHESINEAIANFKPDAVLNCVGIVKQLQEASDAVVSIETNSLLPHRLAKLCAEHGAKLVHLSTDCVFSGRRGNYSESDNPDPVDLYGRSKLLGETSSSGALTLRTSIIGRQLTGHTSLLDWFISNRGGTVRGFEGAIFSGLTTLALTRIIETVLLRTPDLSGVWQVSSQPISKFELLCRINVAFDLGISVIRDTDFNCDRSLDGSAFVSETGILTPSWDEMIAELAADSATYQGPLN